MASKPVIVRSSGGKLKQEITAGDHSLSADEPVSLGGEDSGPNPYELLMAALGACTAMTMKMYAGRKGWPLEGVEVRLTHEKISGRDKFTRDIILEGPQLSAEQRIRLIEIANKCPVHKTLEGGADIETREVRGPGGGPPLRAPQGPAP